MSEQTRRPSPKDVDADRSGPNLGPDAPPDVGPARNAPSGLRRPMGEGGGRIGPDAAAAEAIERATAAVGQDDGRR